MSDLEGHPEEGQGQKRANRLAKNELAEQLAKWKIDQVQPITVSF